MDKYFYILPQVWHIKMHPERNGLGRTESMERLEKVGGKNQ